MPAYAYAIEIKRQNLPIRYDEIVEIEKDALTLADLGFVGEAPFSVREKECGGYTVSVSRTRYETDDERDARVAREEAYMAEYNRRKGLPLSERRS